MAIINGRATAVRAAAAIVTRGSIEIRSLAGDLAGAAAHGRVPPAAELAAAAGRIRMIADILHNLAPLARDSGLGRERGARQELVQRWGISTPDGREWIAAALAGEGPEFAGYPQELEREWQRWLERNPPPREPSPFEAMGPTPEWRAGELALLDGENVDAAASAVLELTRHEPDRAWVTRFLLELVEGDRAAEVRAVAVTCLGHVARADYAIDREAVLPVLRRLLDDPALRVRARESIDVIEQYSPGVTPE
ncbi:hypothetical protein [Dactylosporangium sp. CS-033363]|uniref:hypothetical protein n=1 Tax=Dactylosporangium sp. CS-033363 TaxID=3239935 RepID=UPI003D93B9A1